MIKTKESYSFEDRGTDGQTESISECTQRKYKRSQNYLFLKTYNPKLRHYFTSQSPVTFHNRLAYVIFFLMAPVKKCSLHNKAIK